MITEDNILDHQIIDIEKGVKLTFFQSLISAYLRPSRSFKSAIDYGISPWIGAVVFAQFTLTFLFFRSQMRFAQDFSEIGFIKEILQILGSFIIVIFIIVSAYWLAAKTLRIAKNFRVMLQLALLCLLPFTLMTMINNGFDFIEFRYLVKILRLDLDFGSISIPWMIIIGFAWTLLLWAYANKIHQGVNAIKAVLNFLLALLYLAVPVFLFNLA
ncbi:MAG: hypothetical protein N4A46_02570 [Schleiferiaceae bacterium]|nr:hypothetical protein [Schleiferiaceae bacterium]